MTFLFARCLVAMGFHSHLPHSSRAWCSFDGFCGMQTKQLQGRWSPAFNQTSPLFPNRIFSAWGCVVRELSHIHFVHLYILPLASVTDFLFLQLNITSSRCVDICVDPLYGFVVEVEDEMRRLRGNACNRAIKCCSLMTKTCDGISPALEKDGVKVMGQE